MNTFGIKTPICKSFKFGTFMNSSELPCFGHNNSFFALYEGLPFTHLGIFGCIFACRVFRRVQFRLSLNLNISIKH